LLQAAVQLRDQRPLLTVTPTLKAAQEARSAGSDACSLHKLLHAHGYRWNEDNQWHQLTPGEVDPATGKAFYPPRPDSAYHLTGATQLVVDEAGMLDQEATRALLELADRYDTDVAMIGDRDQLSAVGRGGVLDMAARVATHYVTWMKCTDSETTPSTPNYPSSCATVTGSMKSLTGCTTAATCASTTAPTRPEKPWPRRSGLTSRLAAASRSPWPPMTKPPPSTRTSKPNASPPGTSKPTTTQPPDAMAWTSSPGTP